MDMRARTLLQQYRGWLLTAVLVGAAALVAGCADEVFQSLGDGRAEADEDGMGFVPAVVEQADLTVGIGQTRSGGCDNIAASPTTGAEGATTGATGAETEEAGATTGAAASMGAEGATTEEARRAYLLADRYVAHALEGDNVAGLSVQRMPLPYVGIHSGAVRSSRSALTRASTADIVEDGSNFHDSLTIWGYTSAPYKDVSTETDEAKKDAENSTIFSEVLLKRIRNWRSSAHWPYGGVKMKFYAVAPAITSMEDLSHSGTSSFDTPPKLTFEVPDDPAAQRDLLYGESGEIDIDALDREQHLGQDDKNVPLTFRHILTAVRFAKGEIPVNMTVTSITVKGVNKTGTYAPATGWSNQSGSGSYTLNNLSENQEGENTYIDGNQVLFLMPQTVDGATLTIELTEKNPVKTDDNGNIVLGSDNKPTYKDDNSEKTHTLKCSITGDIWKPGYTVTYLLTVGKVEDDYYLLVEPPAPHEHNDSQEDGSFIVHSFQNYVDWHTGTPEVTDKMKNDHAVSWTVEGYYSDEDCTKAFDGSNSANKPSWIVNPPAGTSGGLNNEVSYSIGAQSPTRGGNHATILQGNETGSAKDLSSGKSANCYIVNAAGSYSFSLIYGNKSSDGAEADEFKDHEGRTIKYKYIKDQLINLNPTTANITQTDDTHGYIDIYVWNGSEGEGLRPELLWQDVDGLVISGQTRIASNQGADGNGKISFEIKNDLEPGNALIALQARKQRNYYVRTKTGDSYSEWGPDGTPTYTFEGNDWQTVWTWHIWVTDEVYSNNGNSGTWNISNNEMYLNYNSDGSHTVSIADKGGNPHTILPVNLGWVPDEMDFGFYSPREVWVKLKQAEPATGTAKVKIMQHARQPLITGTSTIYQWGRPTPFPMVKDIKKSNRPIYGATSGGTPIAGKAGDKGDGTDESAFRYVEFTGEDIEKHYKFITMPWSIIKCQNGANTKSWLKKDNDYNLWSSSKKTVYDPCPPGFQLPSSAVFTGVSLTGEDSDLGTSLNMWDEAVNSNGETQKNGDNNKGGYIYTAKHTALVEDDRYTDMYYLPCTGGWSADQTNDLSLYKYDNQSAGIYWYADKEDWENSYSLWVVPQKSYNTSNKKAIQLKKTENNSTLLPIRPVAK